MTDLRIRQSTLRDLDERCPASAYAKSIEGRESPSGPGARRGLAVHRFFELYVGSLYESKRQTDWDAVPGLLQKVFVEFPELSYEQHQDVTAQARNIAEAFLFCRDTYFGSEESLETTIGPYTITGRIDYLEVDDDGTATVYDIKSNHQIWTDLQVAADFQLRTYAMLVLDSLPNVEVVKGKLLLTRYGLELPRKQEAVWTREDLSPFKAHLLLKLDAHFAGTLKGGHVPGTWCQYCPLEFGECPLWSLDDFEGGDVAPILDEPTAVIYGREVVALESRRASLLYALKDYCSKAGAVAVSPAESFAFHKGEGEDIPAADFLRVLAENYDLVGTPDVSALLSVNKQSRLFKQLRYGVLKDALADVAIPTYQTRFGHKSIGGDDETA
jgi:hypothetical protein